MFDSISHDNLLNRPVAKGGHFGAVPPRWSGVPPAECPPLNACHWVPPRSITPDECPPLSAPPLNAPAECPLAGIPKISGISDYPLEVLPPLEVLKLRRLPPPRIPGFGAPLLVTSAPSLFFEAGYGPASQTRMSSGTRMSSAISSVNCSLVLGPIFLSQIHCESFCLTPLSLKFQIHIPVHVILQNKCQ